METYTLGMLSCHQCNVLLLLYACDIEDSIAYFLLKLIIQQLARISDKSRHVTA